MLQYSSARHRAQLVDALLAAQLALWALRAVGALWLALAPESSLGVMFARGARLSAPFLGLLFIATAFALVAWLDRCSRNLPPLGPWRRMATIELVGAVFMPFFQLLTVPWVVRHLWRASDPTPPRRRWLLATWWGAFIVALLSPQHAALGAVMMVVSAGSLIAIVRDTQRRQDEQYLDDVLRSEVPLPTGDLLR